MELKLRKIGNGYGVLLPRQILEDLHLEEGAKLELERVGNVLQMRPAEEDFSRQVEAFLRTEPAHRNSYRELAK